MSRRPRVIVPGFPHHVTHRGNRHAPVFRDEGDRRFYLSKLALYSERHGIRLYSYSLMTNHVHHVLVPPTTKAASCCLHDLHGLYADYFNGKYGHDGHLWQERFYACVLDDSHLWNAVRYVEQNAVRAGLVERAEDYRWSSARAHCGYILDPLLDPEFPPTGLISDWRAWLSDELSTEALEEIRTATRKGVPCANEEFIRELERLTGMRLLPRRPGRKARSAKTAS